MAHDSAAAALRSEAARASETAVAAAESKGRAELSDLLRDFEASAVASAGNQTGHDEGRQARLMNDAALRWVETSNATPSPPSHSSARYSSFAAFSPPAYPPPPAPPQPWIRQTVEGVSRRVLG